VVRLDLTDREREAPPDLGPEWPLHSGRRQRRIAVA
jgi:hypothetical protein